LSLLNLQLFCSELLLRNICGLRLVDCRRPNILKKSFAFLWIFKPILRLSSGFHIYLHSTLSFFFTFLYFPCRIITRHQIQDRCSRMDPTCYSNIKKFQDYYCWIQKGNQRGANDEMVILLFIFYQTNSLRNDIRILYIHKTSVRTSYILVSQFISSMKTHQLHLRDKYGSVCCLL
jgi:hypothetical protein